VDFICFTDDPELRSDFWKMELLPREMIHPARQAKKMKALPHVYLAQYDWSIYVDNTVRLKDSPKHLFDELLAPAKSPLVCFTHPERNCVYDEAKVVVSLDFDTPERVNTQMKLYRYLGYPAQNGLASGAFLLRRHHDAALQRAMNTWSEQIMSHSRRDQLSMLPACWFDDFGIELIPRGFDELLDWPKIKGDIRLPRDFEEALYLMLNPDLENLDMDLRKHYLLYGSNEGRRYRRLDLAELPSPSKLFRRLKRQSPWLKRLHGLMRA
jgi:hypothetical protein